MTACQLAFPWWYPLFLVAYFGAAALLAVLPLEISDWWERRRQ